MMEYHVLTPAGPELLMYVVDGVLVIVPAPSSVEPADILDETTVNQPCDRHLPEKT